MFGIIKCHRCGHLWIYTGQAITSICPACKTTVRFSKCKIPVNWDFNNETGDIETQNGQVIPYIEKWDNNYSLKLYIVATDSSYGKVLDFTYPVISGLITQEEMSEAVGSDKRTGTYNLTPEMTAKLKRQEIK